MKTIPSGISGGSVLALTYIATVAIAWYNAVVMARIWIATVKAVFVIVIVCVAGISACF